MRRRISALAVAAALSAGLTACGADDDKKDEPADNDTTEQTTATTSTTERDPAVKIQMQEAVAGYNRGYREFFAALKNNGGNLDRLKASIADYRTVIFEFDKDIRAIEFEDAFVPQVNSILENNRGLIAQLDAIGGARNFSQAQSLYQEFLEDRQPTIKAINGLLDQL